MAFYALAWIYFPIVCFAIFLVISAYHFGESQFSEISPEVTRMSKMMLRLSWGTLVIAALIYLNIEELELLFSRFADVKALGQLLHVKTFKGILGISTFTTLALLIGLALKGKISYEKVFGEIYILALVVLAFHLLPVILGFTLFFTTLHSLKVLSQEYNYLSHANTKFDLRRFIRLLTPYTLLSVAGIAILLIIRQLGWIPYSAIFLGILGISILTLPHSVVMKSFYRKLF